MDEVIIMKNLLNIVRILGFYTIYKNSKGTCGITYYYNTT